MTAAEKREFVFNVYMNHQWNFRGAKVRYGINIDIMDRIP